MKKTIGILLAAIMLLALFPLYGAVQAAAIPQIEVSGVQGAPGEEITVAVSIKNSPGFGGMAYDICYDNAVLKLISYELELGKEICTDSGVNTYPNKVNFQYGGLSNIVGDGVLTKLIFEVIASSACTSEISVVMEEGTIFYYEGRREIDFDIPDAKGIVTVNVPCAHTDKVETLPKSPDCIASGNNKYYTCSGCGMVFKGDGATETTVEAEKLPALGHDFTEKLQDAAHLIPGSGSDCQSVMKYYYDCSRCVAVGQESFDGTETGAHQVETVWTTKNEKHYHKCSIAGCNYTEGEAGCAGGVASCTEKAVCQVCGQPYGEFSSCDLTGEKPEPAYLKSGATCISAAVYYKSCTVCGKAGTDAFAYGNVNGDNHENIELRDQAKASCTKLGYSGDTWCKDCGEKLAEGTSITESHELEKKAASPATHETNGNIEHYLCSGCEQAFADDTALKALTQEEIILPKGEHTYVLQCGGQTHWKECDCGNKTEEETHTFGEWIITAESDIGINGSRERICSICSYKQTDSIPVGETPDTLDNTPLGLLITMLCFSVFGIMCIVYLSVHKDYKQKV